MKASAIQACWTEVCTLKFPICGHSQGGSTQIMVILNRRTAKKQPWTVMHELDCSKLSVEILLQCSRQLEVAHNDHNKKHTSKILIKIMIASSQTSLSRQMTYFKLLPDSMPLRSSCMVICRRQLQPSTATGKYLGSMSTSWRACQLCKIMQRSCMLSGSCCCGFRRSWWTGPLGPCLSMAPTRCKVFTQFVFLIHL